MSIEVLRGDFTGKNWTVVGDSLQRGFFDTIQIPFTEVVKLDKQEVTKKEHFVEFTLSDGKSFVSTMNKNTYDTCYKAFLRFGNNPKNINLPIEKESKANYAALTIGVLILTFMSSGNKDEKNTNTNEVNPNHVSEDVELTQNQVDNTIALIIASGYRCDYITKALYLSYSPSYSIACNNYKYNYSIQDIGGTWTVKLD